MKITSKQKEVVDCIKYENPKIIICSGAKRAGKTWILIYAFVGHVAKYENKGYSFILGGTNQASIRRNVLNDLEDREAEKIANAILELRGKNGVK